MPDPNLSIARQAPGGPPAGVEGLAKLRWAVKNPPADPDVSFVGKTVLVTGANVGLGFESALKYAQRGASRVILAVRSTEKGEMAKNEIVAKTGCNASSIVVMQVDMSTFESVKRFVKVLESEAPHLDVVLLNAGLANPHFVRSPEGWEMAVQVCVLSTALMALELLPLLRKTAAAKPELPHLTFVNSVGHYDVKRDWCTASILENANTESQYDATKSYSIVKLLNMAIMKRVAQACLKADGMPGIIVNACCPFLCRTNLGRSFSIVMRLPMAIFYRFTARTAEEGSRTLVGATALGPESHGAFWHHDILYPLGEMAKDDKVMTECWIDILKAIQRAEPRVHRLLEG